MSGQEDQRSDAAAKDGEDSRESALIAAESYVTRSTATSCSLHGSGKEFGQSFKALLEWGETRGLIRPIEDFSFFNRAPDGFGDEHQAWYDQNTNRWFKATYPNRFGLSWFGEDTASPGEYLTRLVLQNKHFNDRIDLVALVNSNGKLRVITSQPHIAGEPASHDEIQKWFLGLQFTKVESENRIAWYSALDNLLVADAHEGNIARSGGTLVPIDLNLIQPTGELLALVKKIIAQQP
jgi:hypothetical protein